MEKIISNMLQDYENGHTSRRQFIQKLTLAVGAMASSATGAAAQATSVKTSRVGHVSYVVSDYKRTRDWYVDALGMKITNDDGKNQCYLSFGDNILVPRNKSPINPNENAPLVDHIAYQIDDWNTDRIKAELERHKLQDRTGGFDLKIGLGNGVQENYVSFHVKDPDGFDVEIMGIAKPGDSQYGDKRKGHR